MSLQFIFGNSGSGKSHYLHEQIINESIKNPKKNYIVLVPEQFTMQTQKDLVRKHPRKGIMNIDILSFGRLAHRIFEEVGKKQKIILDDVGKNFILRKLAQTHEGELKVLRGNLKKIGYISEVKSILSEFTQYDVGEEQLNQMMDSVGEGSYLYWKLYDIGIIYRKFKDYLADKYITGEELLDVLCDVIGVSQILSESVVVLDGFTGFTPVQNRLIRELLKICDEVLITVTLDKREDPYVLRHKTQLFALSKETVTNIMKIAKEEQVEIKQPICLYEKPVYRFLNAPALGFLEAELFRHSKNIYAGKQEAVKIHTAKNPINETLYVAREIRRLVRNEEYRYRDIGIIVSDMSSYAEYIEKAFTTYEIPVFMDHKRSILLNAFVEYVRSFIGMVVKNFTYESVFRFLRTGFMDISEEDVDYLENYVIAIGIKGFKKWQEPWVRYARGMEEKDISRLNQVREALVHKLIHPVMVLKQRKKTVREITVALYELLVQEELQRKIRSYEELFQKDGENSLSKEYAQIYGVVIELLDKFVELLGEEFISIKDYSDLLDAGLEEAKIGIIPPGLDQVVVGDIERTRLKDVKALFILGVNDVFIPGKQGKSGLLSQQDREAFEEARIHLAPGGKEQIYIQKFYLYLNLTKPSEKLYVSYSQISGDGKSLRPAYLIQEIRAMFPKITIVDEEQNTLKELELTPETAMEYLIQGLQDKSQELGSEWKELYRWYLEEPKWTDQITKIIEASFYRKPEDKITAQIARSIYGDMERASVTRMERFSACAFSHFLSYGLSLKDRQEYEFKAMDLGNVFHKALERFSCKLEESEYQWTNLPEDTAQQFVGQSVEESIADYENTILYSTSRNEYIITRIQRLMNRTIWALTRQLQRGDFIPSEYEISFGNGKIDRIDLFEDEHKVLVKVIDYKTGSKTFDLVSLYHGLQLQLAVYMNEAIKLEQKKHPDKQVIPAGIFYYQMKDPIVEKKKEEEYIQEAILKELKLDGLVNANDEVIRHLDKELSGNSSVVPVGRNKDQTLSKASKCVNQEEFEALTTFAQKTMGRISKQILEGETDVSPYEMGSQTGCDYCSYKDICGFDIKIEGYEYRRLPKFKKEEIIKKMQEE